MGKPKSTQLGTPAAAPQRLRREEPMYGLKGDEALYDAIENERSTLAKAESILRCMRISLEYDDGDATKDPYYPDIAEIACELVRQALNGLDSMNLSDAVRKHQSPNKAAARI